MRLVGGVTAWYCPRCGGAVGAGGACARCGGNGVPEGMTDYEAGTSAFARMGRVIGRLFGRGVTRGGEVDRPAGS